MGEELDLFGPFEVDPTTGKRLEPNVTVNGPVVPSAEMGKPAQIPA
jgi:hypothetical protein